MKSRDHVSSSGSWSVTGFLQEFSKGILKFATNSLSDIGQSPMAMKWLCYHHSAVIDAAIFNLYVLIRNT